MINLDILSKTPTIPIECGNPKITKSCRLRNVNMGHYDSYFDITHWYDVEKEGYCIKVTYLPDILHDPRKHFYKSSTKKAGNFITIKDICENIFGTSEPEKGWECDLETNYIDYDKGIAIYLLPQKVIDEQEY